MRAIQDSTLAGAGHGVLTAPSLDPTSSEVLELIVTLAAMSTPASSAASVSLAAGRQEPSTVVASRQLAQDLDSVQYRSGRGPRIEALRSGEEAHSVLPSLQLPELSAAVTDTRICSAWSIPLVRSGETAGALNFYSSDDQPWHEQAAATIRVVAALAALGLSAAADSARLAHGNATLQEALKTRTVIGQAQGILMARQDIQASEAFDILRRASQRTNRKLRDLAIEIVSGVGRTDRDAGVPG